MEELEQICKNFVLENEISCPDAIYQCDHIVENAYEFIEKICDVVGYYNSND